MKGLQYVSTGHGAGEVYLWMRRDWKGSDDMLPATLTVEEARTVANRLLQSATWAVEKEQEARE